jgi:hypothetical protein
MRTTEGVGQVFRFEIKFPLSPVHFSIEGLYFGFVSSYQKMGNMSISRFICLIAGRFQECNISGKLLHFTIYSKAFVLTRKHGKLKSA